jgi:hypothetical protein
MRRSQCGFAGDEMGRRVFVKVVGFSDAERHALNTLFRLSEERDTHYVRPACRPTWR